MSMGFPLDSYGGFCGISMGFLWDVHDISITVGLTKANL